MVLVTVSDVEDEALIRGIDISKYSKGKLERMIASVQSMMEERTGRIFDKQSKTFKIFNHHSNVVKLPYSPVIENDTDSLVFKIDGKVFTNYDLDAERGVIYIESDPYYVGEDYDGGFDVEVSYVCGYDPPHPVAVELAIDIIMYNIKAKEVDTSIDTIKEGDISIKYAKTDALPTDLEKRLQDLMKPLMEILYV
mgnify:CR=1 FL=1